MKKKLLPWIVAFSALMVSGSAAFYSVSGIGKMFAGAALQVMILAGSLEFAKLVTASLLYQYWKDLNKALKGYLLIATIILIIITSAGIYGFLSSAYQETAFKLQNQDKTLAMMDKNQGIVQKEIENYERQIEQKTKRSEQLIEIRTGLQATQDNLIAQGKSTRQVAKQISNIDSELQRIDGEVSVLNDSLGSKNQKITSIESDKMVVSSDADIAGEIGPLKYLSDLTGKPINVVVNWYIIVLMLVFDPLAIALVVAANFAFEKSSEKEETKKETEAVILTKRETTETGNSEKIEGKEIVETEAELDQTDSTEDNKEDSQNSEEEKIIIKNVFDAIDPIPVEEIALSEIIKENSHTIDDNLLNKEEKKTEASTSAPNKEDFSVDTEKKEDKYNNNSDEFLGYKPKKKKFISGGSPTSLR